MTNLHSFLKFSPREDTTSRATSTAVSKLSAGRAAPLNNVYIQRAFADLAGYCWGLSLFGFSAAPFFAKERTRLTRFQRIFSGDRSPSPPIIFPLPLLMIK